jgi:hypothetical protein
MSHRVFVSLVIAIAAVTLAPGLVVGPTSRGRFVGAAEAFGEGGQASTPPVTTRAASDTWTPPRTPDGQPDLQGVWLSNSATPLERPKGLEGRQFLRDDEVAELKKRADRLFNNRDGSSDFAGGDNVFLAVLANPERYKNPNRSTGGSDEMVEREFDNRTSLVVDPGDGKIPPLTPEAQQRRAAAAAAGQRLPAGPEDLSNLVRCVTPGVPRLGGNFGAGPYSYSQILQTAGYVVLIMETYHDARIIPLDGRPHLAPSIHQWNGDSRGRWEGATLVVDTTNFSPKSNFMGSAERLHLVERFTRVAPDTINYEITLNDPTTWTKSWTAMIRLKQTQDMIYEFACHEGSHDLMVGILAGARAQEKAEEEAARTRR